MNHLVNNLTDIVDYNDELLTDNRLLLIKFRSQIDLMRAARYCPDHNKKVMGYYYNNTDYSNNTYGRNCTTAKMARSKVLKPWSYGAEQIQARSDKMLYPLTSKIERERRKLTWDDHGDEIDIDKIYSGGFDTLWRRAKRQNRLSSIKKAEIFIQMSAAWIQTPESMFNQVATGLALAQYLQRKRVQTRIVAIAYFVKIARETDLLVLLNVKNFNQKASLDELAATTWVGNLRTYIFYSACLIDRRCNDYLGYPGELTHTPRLLPKEKPGIKRYLIPRTTSVNAGIQHLRRLHKRGEI